MLESKKIEKVQEFFTRVLFYRCYPSTDYPRNLPSYEERCRRLGLHSLAYRRTVFDLVTAFKIIKGMSILRFSSFYRYRPISGRRGGHSFFVENSKINLRYYSFSLRTARWLNLLSQFDPSILHAKTVITFKKRLSKVDIVKVLKLPIKF